MPSSPPPVLRVRHMTESMVCNTSALVDLIKLKARLDTRLEPWCAIGDWLHLRMFADDFSIDGPGLVVGFSATPGKVWVETLLDGEIECILIDAHDGTVITEADARAMSLPIGEDA